MLLNKLKSLQRRRWALLVLTVLGLAGSAAGNVLNARPTIPATVIALGPPLLFFLAFEVASRSPMAQDRHWALKVMLYSVLAGLAGLMALNSFFHQRDAFLRESGDELTAWTLPLAIDFFMLVCSILVLEIEDQIRNTKARLATGKAPVEEAPVPRMKEPKVKGREKVAMILSRYPEIEVEELAQKTGLSMNYVNSLAKQMRGNPMVTA